MLKVNVPIWLYWSIPPVFVQPLDNYVLPFAPRSHPQSHAPPMPAIIPSQSVVTPSQSVHVSVHSAHAGPDQLPSEMWKEFMIRQNTRRRVKLLRENNVEHQARGGRENTAAKKSCPGKKGPAVFVWEADDGAWTRRLLTRGEVESSWGNYCSSQQSTIPSKIAGTYVPSSM